jgi:hypothetical protein
MTRGVMRRCGAQAFKYEPDVWAAWMAVMRRLPGTCPASLHARAQAHRRGAAPRRVFSDRLTPRALRHAPRAFHAAPARGCLLQPCISYSRLCPAGVYFILAAAFRGSMQAADGQAE